MKKQKTLKQISRKIDHKTGEVLSEENIYTVASEPNFAKLYIQDISLLRGLGKNGYEVLLECMKYLTYQGHITLLAYQRREIAEAIGVTDRTVKNQLAILTSKKIFKRLSNMVYMANPQLFGKGYWTSIMQTREEFELVIEYKNNTRKIKGRAVSKRPNLKAVE